MAVIAEHPLQIAGTLTEQTQQIRFFAGNPDKAKEAAIKSHNARRLNKLKQSSTEQASPKQSDQAIPQPDDFTLVTLSRVRDQMSLLADMMKKEKDPARLDRLAAAFGKLAEVERQLAGRPLPGSLRPSNRPAAGGMIEQPQTSAPGPSSAPPVQSEAQE